MREEKLWKNKKLRQAVGTPIKKINSFRYFNKIQMLIDLNFVSIVILYRLDIILKLIRYSVLLSNA